MGTERVADLLYALVRFTRPRRLLEIGAGYTTPFILQALADNVCDHRKEVAQLELKRLGQQSKNADMLLEDHYLTTYDPHLVSIDDLSHRRETASDVPAVAEKLGI